MSAGQHQAAHRQTQSDTKPDWSVPRSRHRLSVTLESSRTTPTENPTINIILHIFLIFSVSNFITISCYSMGRYCHRMASVCLSIRLWRWWFLITYVGLHGILLHGGLAECLRSPYAKFQRSSVSNLGLNRGGVGKIGDFQPISRKRKRWETELRLLLITNRKWHKPFQTDAHSLFLMFKLP